MRRRDCARNLDTLLVCARKHRQMTMKCAYSTVELQCSAGTRLGIVRGPHVGSVDLKPRKQIICNPRFGYEIKLVRL